MLSQYFKDTKPFMQLLFLGIIACLGLLLGTFISTLFLPIFVENNNIIINIENEEYIHYLRFTQGVTQIMGMLFPAILFSLLFFQDGVSFFQLRFPKKYFLITICGCVSIVTLIPFVDFLTQWNNSIRFPENMKIIESLIYDMGLKSEKITIQFLSEKGIGVLIANLTVMALIPAISEEFLFRGVLQKTCVKWFRNPHAAIVLVAAVFSFIHFDLFNFMPRFLLGLVLGYVYYFGKTIWVPILVHFINNGLIVVVYYLYNQYDIGINPMNANFSFANLWIVLSIAISFLLLAFGFRSTK